jgi:hypothetical protein
LEGNDENRQSWYHSYDTRQCPQTKGISLRLAFIIGTIPFQNGEAEIHSIWVPFEGEKNDLLRV